jgi:hypothetical protein
MTPALRAQHGTAQHPGAPFNRTVSGSGINA